MDTPAPTSAPSSPQPAPGEAGDGIGTVNYTLKQFGSELLVELDRGYDVIRLARWAYSRYLDQCRNLEESLREKIMEVVAMEEGPEFEMSEADLRKFARELTR